MDENETKSTGETVDVTEDTGGNTASPAAAGQEPIETEDLDKEFERLIKGRYAGSYAKRTQQMINRRFREVKELEKFRDEAAAREGNAAKRERAAAALGVAAEYAKILEGAADAGASYPDFDLAKESQSRTFVNLVASGLSVKSAYEALHHDEIVEAAERRAADEAAEAAARGREISSSLPPENGTSRGVAADLRRDVSKLSAAEIKDIIRRVERGEKVKF